MKRAAHPTKQSLMYSHPSGLQNGRPPDLLHQPDADDDDQTANVPGQQQVKRRLESH